MSTPSSFQGEDSQQSPPRVEWKARSRPFETTPLLARLRYVVTRVSGNRRPALNESRGADQESDDACRTGLRATLDLDGGQTWQSVIAVARRTTIDLLTDPRETRVTEIENVALKDSLATGYYIVGNAGDELKKKGILTEPGRRPWCCFILLAHGQDAAAGAQPRFPSLFQRRSTRAR